MVKLSSGIKTSSEIFQENKRENLKLLEKVESIVSEIEEGGGAASRSKHVSRGKLLPRDRISNLLDMGSPFLEIGKFAGQGLYEEAVPSGGVLAGIGRVSGFEVMIVCNDATVKGGT